MIVNQVADVDDLYAFASFVDFKAEVKVVSVFKGDMRIADYENAIFFTRIIPPYLTISPPITYQRKNHHAKK